MTAAFLAIWLTALPPAAAPVAPAPWRLIDRPALHVGVRPAVDVAPDGWGFGATLQVSL